MKSAHTNKKANALVKKAISSRKSSNMPPQGLGKIELLKWYKEHRQLK